MPARDRRHAMLALLATAVTGGCASFAPVETASRTRSGRFAASVRRDGQREAASGRFTLASSPDRTTLDLASPLGNTLARIEATAGSATLTAPRADGTLATFHGENPDALAETVLGYRLPVSGLADWIAGRAAPGRPARVFPQTGLAQRIEQDGWVIEIDERFADTGDPRRLSLERADDGLSAASVQLRLVLDEAGATLDAANRPRP